MRCHKNLPRGDWSTSDKGKVVAHVTEITPANLTFKIRETARQRVIANKCREVALTSFDAQTGRRLVLCRNGRILIHRGRWRFDREITLEAMERDPRWQPDTRPVISGAVARTGREAMRRYDLRKDQ